MTTEKLGYHLVLAAPVVLPPWVAYGHGLLAGGLGWLWIATFFVVTPVLLAGLLLLLGLVRTNPQLGNRRQVPMVITTPLLAVYACAILFPAFVPDGDDYESWPSMAERLVGLSTSATLAGAEIVAATGLAALVVAIIPALYYAMRPGRVREAAWADPLFLEPDSDRSRAFGRMPVLPSTER